MDRSCQNCGSVRSDKMMIRLRGDWFCRHCIGDQLWTLTQQAEYAAHVDRMILKDKQDRENQDHTVY